MGEGQLLKSAGFQYFCCLGVYPHPGWQPGGCYGLPGLLRCHPGAEELSVHGEKLIPWSVLSSDVPAFVGVVKGLILCKFSINSLHWSLNSNICLEPVRIPPEMPILYFFWEKQTKNFKVNLEGGRVDWKWTGRVEGPTKQQNLKPREAVNRVQKNAIFRGSMEFI